MAVERTCVVCRKIDDKNSLLRFVLEKTQAGVELLFDGNCRKAGRGAYCHLSCLNANVAVNLVRSLVIRGQKANVLPKSIEEVISSAVDEMHLVEKKMQIQRMIDSGVLSTTSSKGARLSKRNIRL